jgi:hypothetical protein
MTLAENQATTVPSSCVERISFGLVRKAQTSIVPLAAGLAWAEFAAADADLQ